jgi:hypothetical protein
LASDQTETDQTERLTSKLKRHGRVAIPLRRALTLTKMQLPAREHQYRHQNLLGDGVRVHTMRRGHDHGSAGQRRIVVKPDETICSQRNRWQVFRAAAGGLPKMTSASSGQGVSASNRGSCRKVAAGAIVFNRSREAWGSARWSRTCMGLRGDSPTDPRGRAARAHSLPQARPRQKRFVLASI